MVSAAHAVCAPGLRIAIISTTVETARPDQEIQPAIELLGQGNVLEMFVSVSDIHEPTNNGGAESLFITKSYDATSHFETATNDVLAIYETITGEKLDLNIQPTGDDEDY
jgi:Rab GDP dissociation inhibitor